MPTHTPALRPRFELLEDRAVPAAGDLDLSFNGTGYALTSVNNGYEFAYDVLVQPDHKIVTVGTNTSTSRPKNGSTATTHVIRHLEDGRRDATFGSSGVATVGGTDVSLRDATLQADGKIVLVGRKRTGGTWGRSDVYLTRLEANGTLDRTFGNRGIVNLDLGADSERLEGVAVRPDGRIVAVGYTGNNFAVLRFTPNGALDTTFGTGGRVVTDLQGDEDKIYGLALQPDGKIVVSGVSFDPAWPGGYDFCVARYTEAGQLDTAPATGFGPVVNAATGARSGFVATQFPGREGYALDVAVQPDGKIVAVGWGWFEPGECRLRGAAAEP